MAKSEIRWIRLGDFIEKHEVACGNNNATISGVNINKEFMPSRANLDTTDVSSYTVVKPRYFATNLMHIGRDERIPVAFNNSNKDLVVTSAYTVFRVKEDKHSEILDEYIFLFFNSKEVDRLTWFYTDSSVRGNLQVSRLFDIKIPVPYINGKPDIKCQQAVVDYWQGLRKLKEDNEQLVEPLMQLCRSYLEDLKKRLVPTHIGQFIEPVDERNTDGSFTLDNLRGLCIEKKFTNTKANMEGVSLLPYKIVHPLEFCFVTVTSRNSDKITLAINTSDEDYIVSSSYVTFRITDQQHLLPNFLYLWFLRPEFDRYARFHSWGSARESFDYEDLEQVKIPIPDPKVQQAIVDIYKCAERAKHIAEEADRLSREICPALIQHIINEN